MLEKFASSDTLDRYSQLLTLNQKLTQVDRHVGQLVTDLQEAQAGDQPTSAGVATEEMTRPPGLSRMILSPDDPHKGRFGGTSYRGFYLLGSLLEYPTARLDEDYTQHHRSGR